MPSSKMFRTIVRVGNAANLLIVLNGISDHHEFRQKRKYLCFLVPADTHKGVRHAMQIQTVFAWFKM